MADSPAPVAAAPVATTVVAPVGAPDLNAAPVVVPAASTSPEPTKPEGQPPAQKPDAATERRAAEIARAKRFASSARAKEEAWKTERAQLQQQLKENQAARERVEQFNKAKGESELKALELAGIDFEKASKEWIKNKTGTGKTPAELVEEAVNRKMAEQAKAAAEADEKRQAAEQEKRNAQTVAGIKRNLAELVAKEPDRFDLISDDPKAIDRAWDLCVDFYTQTVDAKTGVGKQLEFSKALDAVETEARKLQRARLGRTASQKLWEEMQQEKAAAKTAAVKPEVSSSKVNSSVVTKADAVAAVQPPPTPPEQSRAALSDPRRIRKQAAELWAQHLANSDN